MCSIDIMSVCMSITMLSAGLIVPSEIIVESLVYLIVIKLAVVHQFNCILLYPESP